MTPPHVQIAFQPIVSVEKNQLAIYGCEALARDKHGSVPVELISYPPSLGGYALDFWCRTLALRDAVALALGENLTLNFSPGAACNPLYGIDATRAIADEIGFPAGRLILELIEHKPVPDYRPLRNCIDRHRRNGVRLALDDFGTGFNGLDTILELNPDIVKVDMKLVKKIETDHARQSLMFAIRSGNDRLGIHIVAEGVETSEGSGRWLGQTLR